MRNAPLSNEIVADRLAGMTYGEIAAKFEIGEFTARSRCNAAMKAGEVTADQISYRGFSKPRKQLSDDEYYRKVYRKLTANVLFSFDTGCWNWAAGSNLGYGQTCLRGFGNIGAHRAMWIVKYGDPGDLDILHTCHNKLCISPLHLKTGTHRQNILEASEEKALQGQWKTHCLRGHPLEGGNLSPWSKFRGCLTCAKARHRIKKLGWPEDLAFSVGKIPAGYAFDFETRSIVSSSKLRRRS